MAGRFVRHLPHNCVLGSWVFSRLEGMPLANPVVASQRRHEPGRSKEGMPWRPVHDY
jgi:hypothetical protein